MGSGKRRDPVSQRSCLLPNANQEESDGASGNAKTSGDRTTHAHISRQRLGESGQRLVVCRPICNGESFVAVT